MTITVAEYKDWRRFHCCLLCIRHPDYEKALDEWEQLFIDRGFTAQELDDASEWIWEDAGRAGSKWSQHAGMLIGHIMRAREKGRARLKLADPPYVKGGEEYLRSELHKQLLARIGKPS